MGLPMHRSICLSFDSVTIYDDFHECLFQPTGQFSSVSNILLLGCQIFKSLETNMCTQAKGPMGKFKALETALIIKEIIELPQAPQKVSFPAHPPVLYLSYLSRRPTISPTPTYMNQLNIA